MKRQRAEVEAPLLHFDGNLARGDAPHVNRDVGVALAEAADERQQRVHRRLVGADQHAAALQVAQLADGRFRFLGEPDEPLPVVLEHPARLGQRPGFRRPIEELLAELDLQTPHCLADRRLRAMHLGGRA